jgi:hypothetical protein
MTLPTMLQQWQKVNSSIMFLYIVKETTNEVLAVPPLFLQESGHSGGIPVDSGGMKFGREAC